jgi:hypothetical protein
MKKTLLSSTVSSLMGLVLLIGLFAAIAPPADAQIAGIYPAVSGGAIVFPANTTNTVWVYTLTNGVPNGTITTNTYGLPGTATNLALSVANYDYTGFTWAFTGTATSTNSLLIYRSKDGVNYEQNASFQYLNVAPGAAAYTTNVTLDIHGDSSLAFVLKSSGTTFSTNNAVSLNLKSPQLFTLPPGNYGRTPGTPITVPNFP